mmetsp:Transcript_93494/g.273749  ORF Transcript_93494/g.273749 Transcript_93494/m.273749 type:complete len:221 (+) Transcript_93494:247-909(+)
MLVEHARHKLVVEAELLRKQGVAVVLQPLPMLRPVAASASQPRADHPDHAVHRAAGAHPQQKAQALHVQCGRARRVVGLGESLHEAVLVVGHHLTQGAGEHAVEGLGEGHLAGGGKVEEAGLQCTVRAAPEEGVVRVGVHVEQGDVAGVRVGEAPDVLQQPADDDHLMRHLGEPGLLPHLWGEDVRSDALDEVPQVEAVQPCAVRARVPLPILAQVRPVP